MSKSQLYKEAIMSIIHDDDMPDEIKLDIILLLADEIRISDYFESNAAQAQEADF